MSNYAFALERAREAFASLARLEQVLVRSPGDPAPEMNYRSRKRLAERYQAELFEIAEVEHIDIYQYTLRPNIEDKYPLSSVSKSLESFQGLFSLIYAASIEGARNTAHLSVPMRMQTQLEFGYSTPGSLGVVLMVPSARDLFSSKFDNAIERQRYT